MERERKRQLRRQYLDHERAAECASLGLSASQLCDLLSYLERVQGLGVECDRSLTHARRWAVREGLDAAFVERSLVELGGNCDCMVVMNIRPHRFGWPDERLGVP